MLRTSFLAFATVLLAAQSPAPKPEPAKAPKVDKTLATIGGKAYRESDFELFLSMALNPQQRMQMGMVQGARESYLKQFLEFKLMETKARKDGLDKGEDYRRKREMMAAQVLVQDLVKRDAPALQEKVRVEDADVKAYYDKHPELFKKPGTFTARHLLISTQPDEKVNQGKDAKAIEDEARAKVAKVQEALKSGKKLEELTQEFSDDPGSKGKGGLYENITFGKFVPEFEEAVRKQEPGKVGEPVKTQFGYHLIQVEKINPSELPAFDTVKDQVRQKALAAKQEEVFQGYISSLKKEIGFTDGAAKVPAKPKAAKAGGKK
ncbi:MAG: peptidylprolyl isomerase [Firmicutes bacterium]|nr:peptidylprolyl isomerase [Bacillota bacterium]